MSHINLSKKSEQNRITNYFKSSIQEKDLKIPPKSMFIASHCKNKRFGLAVSTVAFCDNKPCEYKTMTTSLSQVESLKRAFKYTVSKLHQYESNTIVIFNRELYTWVSKLKRLPLGVKVIYIRDIDTCQLSSRDNQNINYAKHLANRILI